MSRRPPSKEQRERALAAVRRARDQRAAAREQLAPGVSIYPDAPPGTGWVLECEGRSPRFYASREAAIAAHRRDQK